MIEKIKEDLINFSDKNYCIFNKKLIPNIDNILGVRSPALRKIAKKISKDNYELFFLQNDNEYME